METSPQVLSLFGKKSISQQFQVEGQASFEFLHQVHWFIHCTLFQGEISLERPYQSSLNCFELAVLQLLECSYRDPKLLAEMLCFDGEDFIHLLLSDLKDRHFIEMQGHLTQLGKEELKKQKEKPAEIKKVQATFFQNMLTGSLLPYVHIAEDGQDSLEQLFYACSTQQVAETSEPSSTVKPSTAPTLTSRSSPVRKALPQELWFTCGSAGEKTTIRGSVLSQRGQDIPPSQKEVLRVLREYKRYSDDAYRRNAWEISTDYLGNAIFLTKQSQMRYFHLQGGKINGDADTLIISDGLRPSLVDLVQYMEEHESERVELLHQSAIVARRLEEEGSFYENETYPSLKGAWLTSLSGFSGTKDREKVLESAIRRGVVDMYGELEWALHYYFDAYPVSTSALAPYRGNNRSDNRALLQHILDRTKLYQGKVDLISQFDGKLHFTKGSPSMTTLFPLLLIGWDNGDTFLLSRLQKEIPDFYMKLSYLHPIRNKAIHEGIRTISFQDFELYQQFASDFLDVLLPQWKKHRYIRKKYNENNTDTNRRMIAMQNLNEEFGFLYVKQYLTTEMVETLLQLAPENRQPCSGGEYIKGLCLLLELSFAQGLGGMENMDDENLNMFLKMVLEDPETLSSAVVRMVEERYHLTLPKALTTVHGKELRRALEGNPATLGAEVLAFLCLDDSGTGQYLVEGNGLRVIENLISLRGHGNSDVVSSVLLTQKDLEGLRHSVVSMMKGMVEYVKEVQEKE